MRPSDRIETVTIGHADVLAAVQDMSTTSLRSPSLLPGWSRAHVVAHLAHKTRSHVGVFAGARAASVASQYPTGREAAEAETVEWSKLPAHELVDVLADSFKSLEAAWAALPDDAWNRRGISSAGDRAMPEFVDRHMRDVFVHHVDLDVGYRPEDWPATFVETELPKRLRDLPLRASAAALLAWLLGRAHSPGLGAW